MRGPYPHILVTDDRRSAFGRKLVEVRDADCLFNLRYVCRHFLETIFAKFLFLLFFHIVPMASNSCADTISRNLGDKSVSSRAACGRYIKIKACMAAMHQQFVRSSPKRSKTPLRMPQHKCSRAFDDDAARHYRLHSLASYTGAHLAFRARPQR